MGPEGATRRPPESAPGLVLTEGPFLRPGPGPARENLRLLGLWLLPLALAGAVRRPAGDPFDWIWPAIVLTGGLAGALAGAPADRRRRAAADLDWLVTLALGPLLLAPPPPGLPGLVFGLAGGLIGGTLSVRPELARLRAAPGLPALFFAPAAALTVEAGARLKPELLTWPLEVIWGVPSWPFLFAAAAAGLAFNLRPRRLWRLTWPALAAGLWLSADRIGLNVTWLPYFDLTRLVALTLPVFFIIPALARSGRDLVAAEALGLIFLWLPLPATGLFALDRSLPPLAAALAAWFWLSWRWRRGRSAVAPPPPKPEPSAARARLKCGGGGRSPLAADWRGPTSCRLAAAQDGGPRLCPYGCLGLGDCRAVCPHGAIGRDEQGFPLARPQLCRGCGRCAAVCPRGLWELAAEPAQAFIPCASRAALKQSAELCPVSCLGCGRCRKACPAGAIIRTGRVGAPQVDRALCRAGGQTCAAACASACPRRIIRAPAEDSSAGGQYGEAATSRITSP